MNDSTMNFLSNDPSKFKGGPKRLWRCTEHDLPGDDMRCEIMTRGGEVKRAYYTKGKFFISAIENTVVAYLNPEGWRDC